MKVRERTKKHDLSQLLREGLKEVIDDSNVLSLHDNFKEPGMWSGPHEDPDADQIKFTGLKEKVYTIKPIEEEEPAPSIPEPRSIVVDENLPADLDDDEMLPDDVVDELAKTVG